MYKLIIELNDNQHQIDQNGGLLNVKLSTQKLSITNHFLMEPLRLNISLIADEWLIENLIDCETTVYTKVKLYNDANLLYTGYIKNDGISLSYPDSKLDIIAYSNLQLINEFGNLQLKDYVSNIMNVSLSDVSNILSEYIFNKTGIGFSFIGNYQPLSLIEDIDLNIAYRVKPPPNHPCADNGNTETYFKKRGFKTSGNETIYDSCVYELMSFSPTNTDIPSIYTAKSRVIRRRFYNKICEIVEDYSRSQTTSTYNEAKAVLDEYIATDMAELQPGSGSSIGNYSVRREEEFPAVILFMFIHYSGNVIPVTISLNQDATALDAIKIFCVLFNVSILSNENGDLEIANNYFSGGISHGNVTNKCISFKLNKGNKTIPEFDGLNKLIGDTTLLKRILVDYYIEYIKSSVYAEFEIIADTEINIFDTVEINGRTYRVVELQRFLNSEICKIKGIRVL